MNESELRQSMQNRYSESPKRQRRTCLDSFRFVSLSFRFGLVWFDIAISGTKLTKCLDLCFYSWTICAMMDISKPPPDGQLRFPTNCSCISLPIFVWKPKNKLKNETKPNTTGMSELVKERPPNPIEYLASYLIRHDPARAGTVGSKK